MRISINISASPENEKESTDQSSYQSFSYILKGYKSTLDIGELEEIVREWLSKQKK